MKLVLVERDKSSAWYRTPDGKYDVLGDDLNCTGPVARAAGAGPVWSWRPAKPTRQWSNDMHPFTTKAACLDSLRLHLSTPSTPATVILPCGGCGQKNRVVVGTTARCGKCKASLVGPSDARQPDPVDLMMAGRWRDAIAAYESIMASAGDPLGVCAAQIAHCKQMGGLQ